MGWLVPIGVVLVMLGFGGSIGACYQFASSEQTTADGGAMPGPDGGVPADANDPSIAPMVLAPLAGLALALGVACIGVGMGRWQHPQVSDVRPANPWNEQPIEKGNPPVGLV